MLVGKRLRDGKNAQNYLHVGDLFMELCQGCTTSTEERHFHHMVRLEIEAVPAVMNGDSAML